MMCLGALPTLGPTPPLVTQNVATQAASRPQEEPAPPGKFRITPLKPFVTPTRAVYEWRVVCDRRYGSFAGDGSTLKVSNVVGSTVRPDGTATVFTDYIEVNTISYGDGSMELHITQGHWSGDGDPLFSPKGTVRLERSGSTGRGGDGYQEMPAGSFVHPILHYPIEVPLDTTLDLAQIELPVEKFGYVIARRGEQEVYRKAVPVSNDRFPPGVLSSPTLDALKRQGCTVSGSYSRSENRETTDRLVVMSVLTQRISFPPRPAPRP